MIDKLKHTFALSDSGAKGTIRACISCAVSNIVLMLPVVLLFNLIQDLLNGSIPSEKNTLYIIGIIVTLVLIAVTTYIQYNATFFATYVESGVRRLTLAEK